MTGKPKTKQLWKPRLSEAVAAFYSNLSDRAVVDAFVGLCIITAVSFLLLHYQHAEVPRLGVNSIAPADILAPENLEAEDTDQTAALRQRAISAVPPVFDFNSRAVKEGTDIIHETFDLGRQKASDIKPDEFLNQLEQATRFTLDHEQLDVLVKHQFDPEIERLMVDHLETVMAAGVVVNRSELMKLGGAGFVRLDSRTGQESVVTDLSTIRDSITGRAALRSDKMEWPSNVTPSERAALGELLGNLLGPNLTFDKTETEKRRSQAEKDISPVMVTVSRGKPILVKGETVTPVKAALLEAAAARSRIGQRALEFAGTFVIVLLLLLVLWQYLSRYQHKHIRVRRHFLLQIAAIVITLGLARLFFALGTIMNQWASTTMFKSSLSYDYLAPLAVGALLVTLLTDAQAAFVLAAIVSVFVGVLSNNVFLSAYTLISSVGAIYHLKGCRDRTSLIRAGMWIGLVNLSGALALDLLGANEPMVLVLIFDLFCAFSSGMIATMVGSILLPLFEWIFQITTDIKLLELSNLNLPLLRQLAERAPGTYHHSIMVGLLAEAGSEAIGGDALYARVACYYHDIGKMVRPTYFVENQTYMENRHDGLSPRMSSLVLANHVKQGIELAKSYNLPPRLVSAIPEHHGTGLMKYFYYKAREEAEDPASSSLEHQFRYPGPKPQTKETAVIMIADSVEAAARTVKSPTPAKLRNMIDTIIARIRDDGQFDECNITLGDLSKVAESFVKVLTGIHHHRIAYPGYDFDRERPADNELPAAAPDQPARVTRIDQKR